jgi:hypothetical protein
VASDQARAITVFADSDGAHLVALAGAESDRALWPTYLVDEEGTQGPEALGNFLRFVASDYREAPGPYPPAVEQLIASLRA